MRLRWTSLVWLLAAATLEAQTFRGGIQGTVSDQTDAALPGVIVTATSVGTGLSRIGRHRSTPGTTSFSELPLGDYTVTAALPGFAPADGQGRRGRRVARPSRRFRARIRAACRKASRSWRGARSSTPRGNTQGGTIDGEQAAEIAAERPRLHQAPERWCRAPPPTRAAINDSPGSFGLFSVNGNRGRSNNYLLDGTDMNDGYRNLPAINQGGVFGTPATVLPDGRGRRVPDPLRRRSRVRPQRRRDRQHRHAARARNRLARQRAYEYFRDEGSGRATSSTPSRSPKNEFRNNQFGGSLGGPIVKDRRRSSSWPTRASASTAAFRARPGADGPRARGRDRGQRRRRQSRHRRACSRGNPWPAPNQRARRRGNNLQATTPFDNRVRQPHRQARPALRRRATC